MFKIKENSNLKICGIKNIRDLEVINILKPEFCGFILAGKKRFVDKKLALELLNKLSLEINCVLVFAGEALDNILHILIEVNDSIPKRNALYIQFHGGESNSYIKDFRKKLARLSLEINVYIIYAISISSTKSFDKLQKYENFIDFFLLDTFSVGELGGTGLANNFPLIKENISSVKKRYFLSGGINTSNLAKISEDFSPFAFDVATGSENEDFHKDMKKIKILQNILKKEDNND